MARDTDRVQALLAEYAAGPEVLRAALAGMTREQFLAKPIAGKWSVHEVVCHLADAEALYADRIKRVLAEEKPALPGMDPDLHVPRLAIPARDMEEELSLVALIRRQMGRILAGLTADEFQRVGIHSEGGPLTLETLLQRITQHIPHHVKFIEEKRRALASA
jgi:hypothetical protein